jgi:hypothetical protein
MNFFSTTTEAKDVPDGGMFGTIDLAGMLETATSAATQGVGTMSEVFDDQKSFAAGLTGPAKTKEDIEAEEVYEAEKIRHQEREMRRQAEITNGAAKLRGKWAKQNTLEAAKAKAAAEKQDKVDKAEHDRQVAIERDRRLQEKEAQYITLLEARQEETRLMADEEEYTRQLLEGEEGLRRRIAEEARVKAEEAVRQREMLLTEQRLGEERLVAQALKAAEACEGERVAMEAEEWRALEAWRHAAAVEAAIEAEKAACDWDEVTCIGKHPPTKK